MILSSVFADKTSTAGNSSVNAYTKVSNILPAQGTQAPKLNSALTADKATLSGLGKLQSTLASFQGIAQSLSSHSHNLSSPSFAHLTQNVSYLVNAYNGLRAQLSAFQQGELKSDGSALRIQNQLTHIFTIGTSSTTATSSQELANIGITAQENGDLSIDMDKLQNAVDTDPVTVTKIFSHNGKGIADSLVSQIQGLIGPTGSLSRKANIIDQDIAALNEMEKGGLENALTAQANALIQYYSQHK